MTASQQCPHSHVFFQVGVAHIEGSPLRYAEITGRCEICGVSARFRGLPLGLGPNTATMAPDGSEARLPLTFGDEEPTGKELGYRIGASS